MLTTLEKQELITLHDERERRRARRKLDFYTPYPKQYDFHAAGRTERQRLLMAGNRLGKTWSAGSEVAMHLTGRYPQAGQVFFPTEDELRFTARTADPDSAEYMHACGFLENLGRLGMFGADCYPNGWPGRRFSRPISAWVAGKSGRDTRDIVQAILLGDPEDTSMLGTGTIPFDCIDFNGLAKISGVPNAYDTALIHHESGGKSTLGFKSYEQGRERWQGTARDLVWFDEEPPLQIYLEGVTRTNDRNGIAMLTFTPLLGMSEVVRLFIHEEKELTAA